MNHSIINLMRSLNTPNNEKKRTLSSVLYGICNREFNQTTKKHIQDVLFCEVKELLVTDIDTFCIILLQNENFESDLKGDYVEKHLESISSTGQAIFVSAFNHSNFFGCKHIKVEKTTLDKCDYGYIIQIIYFLCIKHLEKNGIVNIDKVQEEFPKDLEETINGYNDLGKRISLARRRDESFIKTNFHAFKEFDTQFVYL